jgi:hypothetical protein
MASSASICSRQSAAASTSTPLPTHPALMMPQHQLPVGHKQSIGPLANYSINPPSFTTVVYSALSKFCFIFFWKSTNALGLNTHNLPNETPNIFQSSSFDTAFVSLLGRRKKSH